MTVVPRDFKQRQEFYEKTFKTFAESWKKSVDFILSTLKLLQHSNCKTIVELGCNDGALAVHCLQRLKIPYEWTGYDFHKLCRDEQRWHPQYKSVQLEDWLWKTEVPKFDIFMASHTFEHLYADEVKMLATWLRDHCKYLLIVAPLGRKGSSTTVLSHVLEKGSLWLRDVLESVGFHVVWETGRYWGWYESNVVNPYRQ